MPGTSQRRSPPFGPTAWMYRAGWNRHRVARARRRSRSLWRQQSMAIDVASEHSRVLQNLLEGRYPDERGRYGAFGGRYVPEILIPAHERLERGARRWLADPDFQQELQGELRDWVGRPTALSPAPHLSARWGARVWLKREDLAHTGAHKINNALGQALL